MEAAIVPSVGKTISNLFFRPRRSEGYLYFYYSDIEIHFCTVKDRSEYTLFATVRMITLQAL